MRGEGGERERLKKTKEEREGDEDGMRRIWKRDE